MSIFTTISGWLSGNANTQKSGPQQPTPTSSAHEDAPVIGVDGALQISTVWACVTLLVETISSLPLQVYYDKNGNRESAKGFSIYGLLHKSPNRQQTSQEFWEQMLLNYFLRGNMYARIQKNQRGEITALYPLSADQMQVIRTDSGALLYEYRVNNTSLVFTESDILHIKGMGNGVIGLSPLDYMRSSLGLAISAQNHTTKTLRKNARRPGILMSDVVLSPEQRKALKENFGDIVSGTDKELYILEAQFKFDPLGMSPADIQLLESRKFSVQDLARWFGVPSVLINDTGETTALGSSVAQIIDGFHRLKLRPQLERIEQALEKHILTAQQKAKGYTIEFNLDALLRASFQDRMELYSKAVQNGVKTRNECRKLENDPPLEGGDILTAQSNLMPLDMLGTQLNIGAVPPEPIQQ